MNASRQTHHIRPHLRLSKRVQWCISMCHATQTRRWSHNTWCHTTCVFRLSGRLLQSQWTLRTCVPFEFYIKHPAAHADISKVTLLSQLTLNASLCCPLVGTFTTVFIYRAVPLHGSVPVLEIEVTLMNGMSCSLSPVTQGVQHIHVSPNIEFK